MSAAAATGAPTNTAPPTITGSSTTGQTLTAQPGTWDGTQPITYAYQWQSCDKNGANCADIGGATSQTYRIAPSDADKTIRVRVTAKNSVGSATATSAQTGLVATPAVTAVSLSANHSLVVYGQATMLTGTATGGAAGTEVTIRGYHP